MKIKKSLTVNTDVSISYGSVKEQKKKSSESIPIPSDPMLIESPGSISILVLPLDSQTKSVKLDMKELTKSNFSNKMKQIYDKDLTYIFSKVFTIQKDIQDNKASTALTKIESLKKEFPNITYLYFLEASIHYILGDKEKSKNVLEWALAKYPNNEDALRLYSTLLKPGEVNRFIAGGKK